MDLRRKCEGKGECDFESAKGGKELRVKVDWGNGTLRMKWA